MKLLEADLEKQSHYGKSTSANEGFAARKVAAFKQGRRHAKSHVANAGAPVSTGKTRREERVKMRKSE